MQEIAAIAEFEDKIELFITFKVEWTDERLFFCPNISRSDSVDLDGNSIYRPDLYIYKLLELKYIQSFTGTSEYVLLFEDSLIL